MMDMVIGVGFLNIMKRNKVKYIRDILPEERHLYKFFFVSEKYKNFNEKKNNEDVSS